MTSAEHPGAYAYGIATLTLDGAVLDVWYPSPQLGAAPNSQPEPAQLTALASEDTIRQVRLVVVHTEIPDLQQPTSISDSTCCRTGWSRRTRRILMACLVC